MPGEKKQLFIISPIRKEGTPEHAKYDKVRRHIIVPAAEEKGYNALRADEIRKPGRITSQIVERLMEDDLVVADISEGNPNVFYELAIRHAIKKPVILIGQSTDNIPFDVRDQRVIPYSLDPDDIKKAITDIQGQIDSIEKDDFKVDSPIADLIKIDVTEVSRSEEEVLKQILSMVKTTQDEVIRTRQNVSSNPTVNFKGDSLAIKMAGMGWVTLKSPSVPILALLYVEKEGLTLDEIIPKVNLDWKMVEHFMKSMYKDEIVDMVEIDGLTLFRLHENWQTNVLGTRSAD